MSEDQASDRDAPQLELLLERLRHARGSDFTGYKRSSLSRRIRRRAVELGLDGFAEYGAYLDANPDEYEQLFNTILINVTTFFRDPESWEALRRQVLPRIIASARDRPQIRIWSAGCASGEEPYTIAMLFADALGLEDFCRRVKIYATDLDGDALIQARRARYPTGQLETVPSEFRERYFTEENGSMVFDGVLRRSVIFGRHDLTDDPPISKLDLLTCRNTLMYFTAATQAKALASLHFGLADHGFLLLGRAEMLLSHARYFTPFELKHRLFTKHAGVGFVPVARRTLHEGRNHDVPEPGQHPHPTKPCARTPPSAFISAFARSRSTPAPSPNWCSTPPIVWPCSTAARRRCSCSEPRRSESGFKTSRSRTGRRICGACSIAPASSAARSSAR